MSVIKIIMIIFIFLYKHLFLYFTFYIFMGVESPEKWSGALGPLLILKSTQKTSLKNSVGGIISNTILLRPRIQFYLGPAFQKTTSTDAKGGGHMVSEIELYMQVMCYLLFFIIFIFGLL